MSRAVEASRGRAIEAHRSRAVLALVRVAGAMVLFGMVLGTVLVWWLSGVDDRQLAEAWLRQQINRHLNPVAIFQAQQQAGFVVTGETAEHLAAMKMLTRAGLAGSVLAALLATGVTLLVRHQWINAAHKASLDQVKRGNRIATAQELASLLALATKHGSPIMLGGVPVPPGDEARHMLLAGKSGSGKTTALRALVRQIDRRGEHALIFDADGSYVRFFYHAERGDIILNPWDARSARWNPLADVRDIADARRIAAVLIPKPAGLTEGAIWYEQARTVLAQVMVHLVQQGRAGLDDLAAMLTGASVDELRAVVVGTPAARAFEPGAEKATASVVFMLTGAANIVATLASVDPSAPAFSFDRFYRELDRHDGPAPMIFLAAPRRVREAAAPIVAAWVDAAASAILQRPLDTAPKAWLFLDELASLPPIQSLLVLLPEGRKFHACVVLAFQSVAQLRQTQASVREYAELESRRLGIQIAFALMFTVIALTVLMSAVLIGLNFANWLVTPIRRLMGAANLVSTGNLHVQVPVLKSEGDLAQLGATFNTMTQELRTQRDELVSASDVIDSRRRFIEAVLSAASAGIIGVDGAGRIAILNRSAEKLIGHPESEALGHPLSDVVPELNDLMATARSSAQRLIQGEIKISRDNVERNLSVRVSSEQTGQSNDSYIITLDDITELVTAQRTSAWADVARRIAHEIKNPLTPIQLSAERIRRKFGRGITEDRAVFDQCTDTIIRQVDDIRRMVDEFSKFARMPKPVIEGEDVADTVRQTVFLMRVGHPDVDIEVDIKQEPMHAKFDRRLISQGLTNIIKNATEAIAAVPPGEIERGRIDVIAAQDGDDIVIDVVDNGIGLPKESRARLLEPYVTTREKGTGLGLAIVGRVLEDHGGRIELNDAASLRPGARGAWVRMRFAISGQAKHAETDETTTKAEAVTGN